jgi:hypothetical protein
MVRTPPHRTLLAITMVIAGAAAGIGTGTVDAQDLIFADGFESGDLSGWGAPAVLPQWDLRPRFLRRDLRHPEMSSRVLPQWELRPAF